MPTEKNTKTADYDMPYAKPNAGKDNLLIEIRCWSLFQDYHVHKDSHGVAKAIRENPELFLSGTFRNFVADVLDGTYKPMKAGYVKKSTVEKVQLVCAMVKYYENMGFPVQYESVDKKNALCASELVAQRIHTTKSTVLDILKKKKKLSYGSTAIIGDGLMSYDGTSIWVLNGFLKPDTDNDIEALESHLKSLNPHEYKTLTKYARRFNPRAMKPLKNTMDLALAMEKLERHEDYKLIQSIQRTPIRISSGR